MLLPSIFLDYWQEICYKHYILKLFWVSILFSSLTLIQTLKVYLSFYVHLILLFLFFSFFFLKSWKLHIVVSFSKFIKILFLTYGKLWSSSFQVLETDCMCWYIMEFQERICIFLDILLLGHPMSWHRELFSPLGIVLASSCWKMPDFSFSILLRQSVIYFWNIISISFKISFFSLISCKCLIFY